jgi:hypothetical protein
MSGGGGDQAGVFDLIAPAERLDDALDMAAALTDVLDEVEVFVSADLLDTDERGWCPGLREGTMANPGESSATAGFSARKDRDLAPKFCRGMRNPRYSAGFQTVLGANCGSWARVPRRAAAGLEARR